MSGRGRGNRRVIPSSPASDGEQPEKVNDFADIAPAIYESTTTMRESNAARERERHHNGNGEDSTAGDAQYWWKGVQRLLGRDSDAITWDEFHQEFYKKCVKVTPLVLRIGNRSANVWTTGVKGWQLRRMLGPICHRRTLAAILLHKDEEEEEEDPEEEEEDEEDPEEEVPASTSLPMEIDATEDYLQFIKELGRHPPIHSGHAVVLDSPEDLSDQRSDSHGASSYDLSGVWPSPSSHPSLYSASSC
ncbi:hypothetical protein PIB30_040616 [Stylosanthes scabra]|uniref:Uncharacterized protein n=1 Tax=Stylosanthes scabra TaxID=79078 RepID=A0ABU6SEZ4_9FABA|nr:hypothetical protein [Stylosanthes scabra]